MASLLSLSFILIFSLYNSFAFANNVPYLDGKFHLYVNPYLFSLLALFKNIDVSVPNPLKMHYVVRFDTYPTIF